MARPVDRTNDLGPRAKPRVDKEARKADYLRAAAKAFLAKGAAASMQDVADSAGAPKPVFYRIFPSRSDLIESFFQHVHDVIIELQDTFVAGIEESSVRAAAIRSALASLKKQASDEDDDDL